MGTRSSALSLAVVGLLLAVSCGSSTPSVKGQRLDRLVVNEIGKGSATTKAFDLPHARYTVFSYADPPPCVRSVRIVDSQSHVLADDTASRRGVFSGPAAATQSFFPSLVQRELQAGSYRFAIDDVRTPCTWMIQGVLNSMLSDDAPPPGVRLPEVRERATQLSTLG